jgi:glucose/arabinose dehydrogenase
VSDSSQLELQITKPFTNTLVKETVATGLRIPWDLTFTPDGILYFTEREGNFKKVIDGYVVPVSHPLNVHAETESGLMGIDFDPQYPSEPYLYVCYSYRTEALEIKNRVSRLTVQETSLNDEQILIDEIPGGTNHNGCRITFGPDNKLYITMGDARVAGNAQSVNNLSGKIMRINRDGSIPEDNPFLGSQVWSYGHRNAQGITFHSNGRLYSSEHGDASEDEINRIIPGGNYGWPLVEGRCNTPSEEVHCNGGSLLEPLTVYTPTLGVSGLAFYDKDMFPEWRGNLLLASLKAGQLYRIILDSEGRAVDEELLVSNDYGRLRDVEVGPDGSIYIAVSNRDGRAFPPFPKPEDDRIIRWSMQ